MHPPLTPERPGENAASTPVAPYSESRSGEFSICSDCHLQYDEDHHPVGFVPVDSFDFSFPLYDGQVGCLTCHAEDHKGGVHLLRGGPYADRREICFRCHYAEKYAEIDPHFMLNEDGEIRKVYGKPVCLVCHAEMPDPRIDRTDDVSFRADIAFLCWRCHAPMVNPIFSQHFLVQPSSNMLRNIEENEREMEVTIPLVPRTRLTCSTCHNPHQDGVIRFEPSAKGADSPRKLRLQVPVLCIACHRV
jgi:hypothetical protein